MAALSSTNFGGRPSRQRRGAKQEQDAANSPFFFTREQYLLNQIELWKRHYAKNMNLVLGEMYNLMQAIKPVVTRQLEAQLRYAWNEERMFAQQPPALQEENMADILPFREDMQRIEVLLPMIRDEVSHVDPDDPESLQDNSDRVKAYVDAIRTAL